MYSSFALAATTIQIAQMLAIPLQSEWFHGMLFRIARLYYKNTNVLLIDEPFVLKNGKPELVSLRHKLSFTCSSALPAPFKLTVSSYSQGIVRSVEIPPDDQATRVLIAKTILVLHHVSSAQARLNLICADLEEYPMWVSETGERVRKRPEVP